MHKSRPCDALVLKDTNFFTYFMQTLVQLPLVCEKINLKYISRIILSKTMAAWFPSQEIRTSVFILYIYPNVYNPLPGSWTLSLHTTGDQRKGQDGGWSLHFLRILVGWNTHYGCNTRVILQVRTLCLCVDVNILNEIVCTFWKKRGCDFTCISKTSKKYCDAFMVQSTQKWIACS